MHHPLTFGATANIKEICCFAAIELDEVERGHRKPGAIADHTDRTIQLNIRETMLLRLAFALGKVAVNRESLPPEGVIVNDEFRIGCKNTMRCGNERVDLGKQGILFDEDSVEFVDDRPDLLWRCAQQFPDHERGEYPA